MRRLRTTLHTPHRAIVTPIVTPIVTSTRPNKAAP